jgi:hypothetical protein
MTGARRVSTILALVALTGTKPVSTHQASATFGDVARGADSGEAAQIIWRLRVRSRRTGLSSC